MQVERDRPDFPVEDFQQDPFSKIKQDLLKLKNGERAFDKPKVYDEVELMKQLEDPQVKEVHVFRNTSENLKHAMLRKRYPNMTRKQRQRYIDRRRGTEEIK